MVSVEDQLKEEREEGLGLDDGQSLWTVDLARAAFTPQQRTGTPTDHTGHNWFLIYLYCVLLLYLLHKVKSRDSFTAKFVFHCPTVSKWFSIWVMEE